MIRSLKTGFGLSMLVALLVAAFGVMNASATTSGHFTSESAETKLDISEETGTAHTTTLSAFGSTVTCHKVDYSASNIIGTTTQTITAFAEYTNCTTGTGGAATVRMNGCHYQFTSRSTGHGTTHFICPAGKKAEVESSAGTMKFGAQTPSAGATYSAIIGSKTGKNAITASITAECHGACQFIATHTSTATLKGSVTVEGTNAATGAGTGIQAT
jgi:hypothetical protein